MALKNSRSGSLPVSEIYSFMCEHFPYFESAPSGWKNSVRHNLSLNKCFEKIEKPATNGNQRKGCLWAMNPERIAKMDEEVQKWSRKDPMAIRNAMVYPEHLEALERGEMKHGSSSDSDVELDSQSEIEETSDSEQDHELDETIVENMFVEEDIAELGEETVEEVDDHHLDEEHVEELGILSHHDMLSMVNGGGGVGSDVTDCIGVVVDDDVVDHCHDVDDDEVALDDGGVDLAQQHRDFDIEVEDIYDAIDMEDDKEAVRMAISQSDIIEMGTADIINAQNASANGYQSPKRARLNVNYAIRTSNGISSSSSHSSSSSNGRLGGIIVEKQHIQQIPAHTFRHIKVQQQQQLQQQQQQHQQQQHQQQQHQQQQHHNHQQQQTQQQHIVVQSLATATAQRGNSPQPLQQLPQFHQITIPQHNRRKMQLVNRIA